MKNLLKNASKICFTSETTEKLVKTIDQLIASNKESKQILGIIEQLKAVVNGICDNVVDVLNLLKKINKDLTSFENKISEQNLVDFLCELFVLCHAKHPCKKIFASILLSSGIDHDVTKSRIQHHLALLMHGNNLQASHVVQTIEQFCIIFPHDVVTCLSIDGLQYMLNVVKKQRETLLQSPEMCMETLEKHIFDAKDTIKCCNLLAQKHEPQMTNKKKNDNYVFTKIAMDLQHECLMLLQQDKLEGECWNAAGLLVSCLMRKYKHNDEYFKEIQTQFSIVTQNGDDVDLWCKSTSDGAFVALSNGFLVTINSELETNKNKDAGINGTEKTLNGDHAMFDLASSYSNCLDAIFQSLKCIQERVTSVPDQITMAKCLVQWTLTARNFLKLYVDWHDIDAAIKWLLSYASVSLDHPVDAMRHQTRDVFINVLAIGHSREAGSLTFVQSLTLNVLTWDWHKRSLYVSLQCILEYVSVEFILTKQEKFQEKLLTACCSQSLAPYASHLYGQLAQKHDKSPHACDTGVNNMELWLKPALNVLRVCEPHQATLLLDYCIVKLLKLYGQPAVEFVVSCLNSNNELSRKTNNLNALIMCLRISQRLGLLEKASRSDSTFNNWKQGIDQQTIKSALIHQNYQIRLDSFCLVCESWKPSILVTESDIELIKYGLPYNMTRQCPAFRQNLFNTIKKLLDRLLINCQTLQKKNMKDRNSAETLKLYKDFKQWLINFCFDQLYSDACYPRKSLSLHLLHHVVTTCVTTSDDLEITIRAFTTDRTTCLANLLKDTYEDNRSLALDTLTCPVVKDHVKRQLGDEFLWNLLQNSLETGRKSCKPEVCRDSAFNLRLIARINPDTNKNVISMCEYFTSCLEDDVEMAKRNLRRSVQTAPMYGCLYCLRMLLTEANVSDKEHRDAYRKLLSLCVDLCFQVAAAVLPVVGSESPEGCIPEPADKIKLSGNHQTRFLKIKAFLLEGVTIERRDEHASAQRVLVSCWRSAKESYLLLQQISSRSPLDSSPQEQDNVLSWKQFLDIGEHLRTQLMETVHRGTFEVAYTAFKAYCPLLWRSNHDELNRRPKEWIYSTISDICDPVKAESICVTRRSAGLPFFLQALLGGDKGQVARECIRYVMSSLLSLIDCDVISTIRKEDNTSSQVHALNVLRGLMKDASLGEEILPYVPQCLMVAISGFGCKVWQIRNSSTLLFSALVTRIFGVKREKDLEISGKNRLSSHEFFTRMPQLQDFLLQCLNMNLTTLTDVSDIERQACLYPVLLLLSRVYPSSTRYHSSNDALHGFRDLLIRCGHSPILKCRIMAATALASIVPTEACPLLLCNLAQSLNSSISSNETHGTLHQLLKLVTTKCDEDLSSEMKQSLRVVFNILCSKYALGTRVNECVVTRSSYIELCLDLTRSYFTLRGTRNDWSSESLLKHVHQLFNLLITDSTEYLAHNHSLDPGYTMLHDVIGRLFSAAYVWNINRDCVIFALNCGHSDVTYSSLRHLKKELKRKSSSLEDVTSDFQDELIKLASSNTDNRCLIQAYKLIGSFLNPSRSDQILTLTRQLTDDVLLKDDKLLGAVVTCQASCLHHILAGAKTRIGMETLGCIFEWLVFLARVCTRAHNDVGVRVKAASALRTVGLPLFVDACKLIGGLCIDAWRILIILLVDEDDVVRQIACDIVHSVALKCGLVQSGEAYVDSLSLEVAMDSFVTLHGRSHPERCVAVLDHVERMANQNKSVEDDSDLFDPSAANTYIEASLLSRLIRETRVRIPVSP